LVVEPLPPPPAAAGSNNPENCGSGSVWDSTLLPRETVVVIDFYSKTGS
jgi:hypothetical protein